MSTQSKENLDKLKRLLGELFQFEKADLDFGIYRIMNERRDHIRKFIDEDLVGEIKREFESSNATSNDGSASRATELAKLIKTLEDAGVDPETSPKYRELKAKAEEFNPDLAEAEIFDHVYTFFSRYYENGDFVSKRRFGKNKYSVPYNGEETLLHFANADQYYVKSGEGFTNYAFKTKDATVRFLLISAETEKNNNKEKENRFFVLYGEEFRLDKNGDITVNFEYRNLTEEERKIYGTKNTQDAINREIKDHIEKVTSALAKSLGMDLNFLTVFNAEGFEESGFLKHLNRYTRKNREDFFIHKDLAGFLRRELDFFVKNELLPLDDILRSDENGVKILSERLRQIRLVENISGKIIDFLAGMENFQKKIFEKRKLVVENEFSVSLDRIFDHPTLGKNSKFLKQAIFENTAQKSEWEKLFGKEAVKSLSLDNPEKENSVRSLLLDTAFLSKENKSLLLSEIENIDDQTNALLVSSENFQALNLLLPKYQGKVKCIYIDPPYNTGSNDFIYKDNYRHSTWLAMMEDRLRIAREFLSEDGVLLVSIDDNEIVNLRRLLDNIFGSENFYGTFTWINKSKPVNMGEARFKIQSNTEYILSYGKLPIDKRPRFILDQLEEKQYPFEIDGRKYRVEEIVQRRNTGKLRRDTMVYPLLGSIMPKDGYRWQLSTKEHSRLISENKIQLIKDKPYELIFQDEEDGFSYSPFWTHLTDSGTAESGKSELSSILGYSHGFETVKPLNLLEDLFSHILNQTDTVLDFFAGSGTSAQAIFNLNRADKGDRKVILIEMGEYFDKILYPRVLRVAYSSEWSDSKPEKGSVSTSSFIKRLRLEQYEDALNNLEIQKTQGSLDFGAGSKIGKEYFLKYSLDFETQGSLLSVGSFKKPSGYSISFAKSGEIEKREADLPTTFEYLLGISVSKVFEKEDSLCIVGKRWLHGKEISVLVIWRDMESVDDIKTRKIFDDISAPRGGWHEIYVNGDCSIPNALLLEEAFKSAMFPN